MKQEYLKNSNGFTLVELLVTLFLTAIAAVAIYRGYTSFSQSTDAQQQTMEMQQNLRIGMYAMVKDILRAGMKEEDSALVAFATAGTNTVEFGMDLGSDNNIDNFAIDGEDNDDDGVADDKSGTDPEGIEEGRIGDGDFDDDGERIKYSLNGEDLQREVWDFASAGYLLPQTVITNVSKLNFVYLDEFGTVIPPPITSAIDLNRIDTVEITLVVRTTNEDYRISNNRQYNNLQDVTVLDLTATPDNFRRRLASMRVKVRNINL